jgi:hypothetical protein
MHIASSRTYEAPKVNRIRTAKQLQAGFESGIRHGEPALSVSSPSALLGRLVHFVHHLPSRPFVFSREWLEYLRLARPVAGYRARQCERERGERGSRRCWSLSFTAPALSSLSPHPVLDGSVHVDAAGREHRRVLLHMDSDRGQLEHQLPSGEGDQGAF